MSENAGHAIERREKDGKPSLLKGNHDCIVGKPTEESSKRGGDTGVASGDHNFEVGVRTWPNFTDGKGRKNENTIDHWHVSAELDLTDTD